MPNSSSKLVILFIVVALSAPIVKAGMLGALVAGNPNDPTFTAEGQSILSKQWPNVVNQINQVQATNPGEYSSLMGALSTNALPANYDPNWIVQHPAFASYMSANNPYVVDANGNTYSYDGTHVPTPTGGNANGNTNGNSNNAATSSSISQATPNPTDGNASSNGNMGATDSLNSGVAPIMTDSNGEIIGDSNSGADSSVFKGISIAGMVTMAVGALSLGGSLSSSLF
ncbi:hypothetical protein EV182_000860 [Spiromyces aspiralis]|uniref:Uncharacterized protein n=1 Tax=Spiromyces aspiralis TaxID=68401 RepID=A0ACC1HHY0_9FUNG|nr:hypothetical protein EV182_000860 [Spiromyces aspiralis]